MKSSLLIAAVACVGLNSSWLWSAGAQPATPESASPASVGVANGRVPLLRLSGILGAQVQDERGQPLGQIRDVIMDPVSGQVELAMLARTGTSLNRGVNGAAAETASGVAADLGAEARHLLPLPWRLFSGAFGQPPPVRDGSSTIGVSGLPRLVLKLDEAQLRSAPTINDWSELHRGDLVLRVQTFYAESLGQPEAVGRPRSESQAGTGTGGETQLDPAENNRRGPIPSREDPHRDNSARVPADGPLPREAGPAAAGAGAQRGSVPAVPR